MSTVFPQKNLPGVATVWGREVESRSRNSHQSLAVYDAEFDNLSRSTSGSLSTTSDLLARVYSQYSTLELIPSMSVTGNPSSGPSALYSFSSPSEVTAPQILVTLSGFLSGTGSPAAGGFVVVQVNGSQVIRSAPQSFESTGVPPSESSGGSIVSAFGRTSVHSGGLLNITVRVFKNSGTNASTVSLDSCTVSLSRSGEL